MAALIYRLALCYRILTYRYIIISRIKKHDGGKMYIDHIRLVDKTVAKPYKAGAH